PLPPGKLLCAQLTVTLRFETEAVGVLPAGMLRAREAAEPVALGDHVASAAGWDRHTIRQTRRLVLRNLRRLPEASIGADTGPASPGAGGGGRSLPLRCTKPV